MNITHRINHQRKRRALRTRTRIEGTAEKPRLSVFRSNTRLSVQLIDDRAGKTLFSAQDVKGIASAKALGKKVAEGARRAGIAHVVFDRGAYRYHGNVQAIAEGARAGGLKF